MVFDGDIVSAKVKGKPKPKRLEPRLKFDVNEEDKNLVCKLLQQRESSPSLNSKDGNSTSCILFHQNDQFAKQRLLFTGLIWEVVTLVENDDEKRNLLYSKLAKRLGDFAGFQHLDLKLKTLDPLRNRVRSTLNHLILTLKTDLDATTTTTGQNGFNGRRLPSLNSRHDKILSFYNDSYFLEPSRFQREYENLGLIEEGGFGFVCKVTNKLDGNSYALKVVPFRYKTCEAYERIMREVRVFASLKSHPNLVAYKTSWLEKCIFGGKSSLSRMAKLALPPVSQATTVTATDSNSDSSSCVKIIEISDKSLSLSSLSVIDQSPEVEPIVGSPEDVENFTRIIKSEANLVDDNFFFNNRVRTSSNSSESSNGFDFGASLYIQMELCDKNLKTWIKERNDRLLKLASKNGQTKCLLDHIDLTECLNIFKEILIGLKAIHDNQLIHRDLKPQNILFGLDGKVKIGDFGLSTIDQCREEQLISSVVFATQPLQKKGKGHTMGLGTSAYAAPEQKLSRKYDRKVDIYSLGMVAFEVFHPFVTNMERSKTFDDLTRNHSLPSEFSASLPEVAKLILRMTSALPVDRPDANEILHSDLFAQDGHSEMDELRKEVAILRSQLIEKDEEIKRLKEALLLKS